MLSKESEEVPSDSQHARFDDLYDAADRELTNLYLKWKFCTRLYGSKDTVDVLNAAAGTLFLVVQNILVADIILHIARLTGPSKSGGQENLTIERVITSVDDAELRQKLDLRLRQIKDDSTSLTPWRNKVFTHLDLGRALDENAQPLPPITRGQIEKTLSAMAAILNAIQIHYKGAETRFDGIESSRGAEALIYYLQAGMKADDARRRRLQDGHPLPEDLP